MRRSNLKSHFEIWTPEEVNDNHNGILIIQIEPGTECEYIVEVEDYAD